MPRKYEDALRRYVERIADREFPPGDWLPREKPMAEEFSFSRNASREVNRALQERGLVTVVHGRGARVNDERDWHVLHPEVLAALITRQDAAGLLAELVECRRIAEPEAAALAAQRATGADIVELTQALDAAAAAAGSRETERRAAAAAERRFHMRLLQASGNRPLVQMLRPLHEALAQAGELVPRRAKAAAERRRVLDAVAARDPDAARETMAEHLDAVARSLRRGR